MSAPQTNEEPRLTKAMIDAAIESIRNAPLRCCGVTELHVVSPKARGWTICAKCLGPCFVCVQESGCDGTSHDIRCNELRYQSHASEGDQ